MTSSTGRDLLLGLLAAHNDFLSEEELSSVFQDWQADRSRSMFELLAARGLTPEELSLLDALTECQLSRHQNDSAAGIAGLSGIADLVRRLPDLPEDLQHQLPTLPLPAGEAMLDEPLSSSAASPRRPRFRIIRPHARGGLGEVFVARDSELNRDVALKEILPRYVDREASRNRFLLEAEITGGLEHPGIVPVYGLGQYGDGRPYYAMRFIKGASLNDAAQRFHEGSAPAEVPTLVPGETLASDEPAAETFGPDFRSPQFRNLLGRLVDVCNAIQYAHSRGVLHRDLKPGNIMLGKYGETLVVDWGLAKLHSDVETAHEDEPPLEVTSGSQDTPTMAGQAIGTPAYMPPEQAIGDLQKLGPASDVYSLGATLYHILTGRPPYTGADTITRVVKGELTAPRSVISEIPRPLESICLRAMSLEPVNRYASPRELADDIENYLADARVAAHTESFLARTGRWLRRNRQWARAGLMATAVVLVALIATVVTLKIWNTEYEKALYMTLTRLCEGALYQGDAGAVREMLAEGFPNVSVELRGWEYGFINQCLGAHLTSFRTSIGVVHADFSDDEKLLVCDRENQLTLWDVPTQEPLATYTPDAPVSALAVSSDARVAVIGIATEENRHRIELWNIGDDEAAVRLDNLPDQITTVNFSRSGELLAVGDAAATMRILNARTLEVLHEYSTEGDWLSDAAFDENDRFVVSADLDCTVTVWDRAQGKICCTLYAQYGATAVAFVHAGQDEPQSVLIGEEYGLTERYKLDADGQLAHSYIFWEQLRSVSDFAIGRHWWAIGSTDRQATLGRVNYPFRDINGHSSPVIAIDLDGDEERITTIGTTGIVKVWSTLRGQNTILLSPDVDQKGKYSCVAIAADGKHLVTGGTEDEKAIVAIWDDRYTKLRQVVVPGQQVLRVGFSPDGHHLLAVSNENTVTVVSTAGETLWSEDHTAAAVFLSNSRVAIGREKTLRVLLLDGTSTPLATFDEAIVDATTTKTGRIAVAAGREVHVLDAAGVRQHTIEFPVAVRRVALSDDGRLAAATSGGFSDHELPGPLIVWDAESGAEQFRLTPDDLNAGVNGVAFSASGDRLFVTGYDYRTIILRTTDGATLYEMRGHEGAVLDVAVNTSVAPFPVATASQSRHVIVREATDWRE